MYVVVDAWEQSTDGDGSVTFKTSSHTGARLHYDLFLKTMILYPKYAGFVGYYHQSYLK
jgi:hypothetical protein